LHADGTILDKPGYDADTQAILVPDPALHLPSSDEVPTEADAREALSRLKQLLSGFEFNTPVDLSAALSVLLTTVVRSALSVAPLHLIRATTAGAGKSFLADIAAAIVTGRHCPVITMGQTREESEKRLGGLLREGVSVISLDNLSYDLEGDLLCQIAERPLIRIRILGSSDVPEFECRSMVLATGNNVGPRGDMVRRTIVCNLGTNVERPELRTFGSNPLKTVLDDRGPWLWDCFRIIRAYIFAGRPPVSMTPLGSYQEWSTMVRAPLVWLGEEDPVRSMEQAREEDPTLMDIQELFEHLRRHFRGSDCTALKIAEVARTLDTSNFNKPMWPEFQDLLIRRVGERGNIPTRRLSVWLRHITGKVVDNARLRSLPGRRGGHGPRYLLEKVEAQEG
jgi:hypothetical protein